DNKQDLAVANYGSNTVSFFFGNGNGSFQNPQQVQTGAGPLSLLADKFFGTAANDLISLHNGANLLTVMLGNGDGTFQAQRVFTTPGSGPGRVVVGDFNNDGRLDLAVLRTNSNVIALLLGDGAGNFTVAATPPIAVPVGTQSLAVGDFNND